MTVPKIVTVVQTECQTCGCAPCPTPLFCATCTQADKQEKPLDDHTKLLRKLLADNVSLERAQREIILRRGRRCP